jgi:hypothetical protein
MGIKDDGSSCVGCLNLKMFNLGCKKEHKITMYEGCKECGKAMRLDTFATGKNCEDYDRNPNYWEKDPYG